MKHAYSVGFDRKKSRENIFDIDIYGRFLEKNPSKLLTDKQT